MLAFAAVGTQIRKNATLTAYIYVLTNWYGLQIIEREEFLA